MKINCILILAVGLGVGYSFLQKTASPQRGMIKLGDVAQPPVFVEERNELSNIVAFENEKPSEDVLSVDLVTTGLFENLPPKLTTEEIAEAKSKGPLASIFCTMRGFTLDNTPRNAALIKIALALKTKVTLNKEEVKVVMLSDTIPISFYDFVE